MKIRNFLFGIFMIEILLLGGCDPVLESGSSSQTSLSKPCGGSDPTRPPPGVPNGVQIQSVQPTEKLSKMTNEIKAKRVLHQGTAMVAIYDEVCTRRLERDKITKTQTVNNVLSFELYQKRMRAGHNPNGLKQRAYSWKLDRDWSFKELNERVQGEPCLVHLTEDIKIQTATVINDSMYSYLDHLPAIRASEAWDLFFNGTTGITQDVVIAIIDSGVDIGHEDLSGQLWVNPGEIADNGIDDDGNGYIDDINGYNFVSQTGNPSPETWPSPNTGGEGHGTHVAGLAAAQGNNGLGVVGIMWSHVKIMSLNVFGPSASGSVAEIINAINYAAGQGADVINMSLGAAAEIPSLMTAMQNAVAQGVTILVAAGNAGEELTEINFYSPAAYGPDLDGLVTVGSLDVITEELSSFSNHSSYYVELLAPGSHASDGGLLSTYPGDTYAYMAGTSMASPVAAGAAALIIGQLRSQGKSFSPAKVEEILLDSSPQDLALGGKVKNSKKLDLLSLAQVLYNNCY